MVECVNCGQPATGEYTLVVHSGALLEEEPFCDSCHALFEGSGQFEVHKAPVLLRGGQEKKEPEEPE